LFAVPHSSRTTILRLAALALGVLLACSLVTAAASDAAARKRPPKVLVKNPPLVGVGDNNAPMFADSNYRALHMPIARRIVPYDFYQDPGQLAALTAWIQGALADGVDPLISFEHSYTYPTKLPTVAEYLESLNYLRQHFPAVTTISPWNEANHKSQPTVNNPRRAAEYYNATRQACPSCTIVAADVLDQKNLMPWLKKFKRYAKRPKIWGLHSYTDTNHNKSWKKSTTRAFLAATTGQVWLTEVGGIVSFNYTYAFDPARASVAITKALDLGLRSPRIKRIYLYCWFGSMFDASSGFPFKWDSGIVQPNGDPRPGYFALRNWLSLHPRH
jgi:hypothetical protein